MRAVVWSKTNCPYCVKAKAELSKHSIVYEERAIGEGWDRDQLLEAVPNAKTVPQIFIDDVYVGTYDQLMTFVATNIDEQQPLAK